MNLERTATAVTLGASLVEIVRLVRLIHRGAMRDGDLRWVARIGVRERSANRLSVGAAPRFIALEAGSIALLAPLRLRERGAIVLAPVVAGLAGQCLKRLVPRERPGKSRFSPEGGESFPSTHAAHATSLAMILAYTARGRGVGAWCFAPAAAASALVGIERIRGAAHWPSDVLAGFLLGIAAASLTRLLLLGTPMTT